MDCDTFLDTEHFGIDVLSKNFNLESKQLFPNFVHYVFENPFKGEMGYLNLLRDVFEKGFLREGRNGYTKSIFHTSLSFNLKEEGFPLLTTKKMFLRGIVEELIFFLKGQTNSKILEEKKINIWKGNTSKEFLEKMKLDYPEGEMGPMYGFQWRHFNAPYPLDEKDSGIDQLLNLIEKIKSDPDSRRLLMTDFNPCQADLGVLYPCHSIIQQFYVENDRYLDMFVFNRSSDLFLGLPFNIASSALMLMIIAKLTDLEPRWLHISLGDAHIYDKHITENAIQSQLQRVPRKFPRIEIKEFSAVEDLTFDHFDLYDYDCHEAIKATMVA